MGLIRIWRWLFSRVEPEDRGRLFALLGTVMAHLAVVAWLVDLPEKTAAVLRAVEMEVVDLTPEPEPEVEELPEKQPEPEPEPEPEPQKRRRPRPTAEPEPEPEETPEPEEAPSEETPPEVAQAEPPPVIDFGEQNFANSGTGAGFNMKVSEGNSRRGGLYRPGETGGSGTGNVLTKVTKQSPPPRPDFDPVPNSRLSRDPTLVGTIRRVYPSEARRQFIEGNVRLMVEIRANGRVRNVRVLTDPGGGLGRAAVEALRQARFRPAMDRNGRPVDCRIVYTVRYLLED